MVGEEGRGDYVDTVAEKANATCTSHGIAVNAANVASITITATVDCQFACSIPQPVTFINPHIVGGNFVFAFLTQTGHQYSIFYTPIIVPANWQLLSNFTGDGSTVTIQDPMTQSQRFYRVLT